MGPLSNQSAASLLRNYHPNFARLARESCSRATGALGGIGVLGRLRSLRSVMHDVALVVAREIFYGSEVVAFEDHQTWLLEVQQQVLVRFNHVNAAGLSYAGRTMRQDVIGTGFLWHSTGEEDERRRAKLPVWLLGYELNVTETEVEVLKLNRVVEGTVRFSDSVDLRSDGGGAAIVAPVVPPLPQFQPSKAARVRRPNQHLA